MTIVVAGGDGQLARALVRRGAATSIAVVALGRATLDVTREPDIERALRELRPTAVINAAAYTAVDRAEAEAERDRAFAVNATGAGQLARACAARGVALLHVSTDYVFDGTASAPIGEDAAPHPINVYGESKLAGEDQVRAAGGTVVRTSWLFGARGRSFVHAILRRAREQPVLRVVADQHGCPTWTDDLADALLALAARPQRPAVLHVTGDEPTTWHAFAEAIVAGARAHGPLRCERIEPITAAEYPTAARRPRYTVLDTARARSLGLPIRSWRDGLARTLAEELAR